MFWSPCPACLPQRCWEPPPGAALVFNCQMGRGRTTTGMIIASLLYLRKQLRGQRMALPLAPQGGWQVAGKGEQVGG